MKKIIFIILFILSLVSCSEEQKKKVRESLITPNDEWFYKGHHYLEWNGSQYRNGIIHDPDCPCYLDTLSIYVVDSNDTAYIIKNHKRRD